MILNHVKIFFTKIDKYFHSCVKNHFYIKKTPYEGTIHTEISRNTMTFKRHTKNHREEDQSLPMNSLFYKPIKIGLLYEFYSRSRCSHYRVIAIYNT